MNDRDHRDKRRRQTRVTDVPDDVDKQARYCIELIEIVTRRHDLPGRDRLLSVAATLQHIVPPGATHVPEDMLLCLVEAFGDAVCVAGHVNNTLLPTVDDVRDAGRQDAHAGVLESAARYFEWRSREWMYRHELIASAIDVARVCGLLTPPYSPGREQAVIRRAAANVIVATRLAVSLADPDACEVWQEENRMQRQPTVDDVERAFAARRCNTPPKTMN